ncbi:MAG: RNA polymerase factor sigma-54 [Phycisphaerales bacterium]
MRFDTSQQMRIGQQMKLAPRMIQSMEILQMPLVALEERIEQELESNIALERVEAEGEAAPEATETVEGERELVVGDGSTDSAEDFERLGDLNDTYGEMLDDAWSGPPRAARETGERDGKMDAMANVAARGASLEEQLLDQWRLAEVDPHVHAVGELLIGYVDADGFISTTDEAILEQWAAVPGLELDEAIIGRSVQSLQQWLEPPGMAARDLRESLLLQVEAIEAREDRADARWDDVRTLIRDHYEDMLQNRLPRITAAGDLSLDDIHGAMRLMRNLNLSPGRDLVDVSVPHVIPDIIVEYDDDADAYIPRVAGDRLPSLRLNDEYVKMARDKAQEKTTREFVGRNVQNAQWIMDAIRQRRSTLLRVAAIVVAHQRAWFDDGPQALRPLPMVDVADQLGIHVATVSRAVSDKWMQTPRGIVPLRRFFSGGTQSEDGRDMSWEAVRATLQELIDGEDKGKPMSDEALAGALKERGISIARRTVVKYRQQLNIPPARHRKVHA